MAPRSFCTALAQIDLGTAEKTIIQERYVNVIKGFELRCFRLAFFFHIARFIVTVGSLIVPALLSIQYVDTNSTSNVTDPNSFVYRVYWSTWVISLFVSICNGVLSVFKIEKKYYFLHTTLEHLRSEGWQFLELSGHYSGFHTPNTVPTHANQFIFFCHIVEKIKMKQVEEEYYKLVENHNTDTSVAKQTNSDGTKKDTIIPITPLKPLVEQAKALPPELLDQIVAMVKTDSQDSQEKSKETVERQ
jgi:hypothetical protein